MVKLGEFFLEDRAAPFEPTVDLREDIAQRETLQPFRETGQNAHDDAASLRAGSRLAGPCHLAGHRFRAGLPLATVVRRLDLRMQHEDKELLDVVNQFILQTHKPVTGNTVAFAE